MRTELAPAKVRLSDELGHLPERWYCVSRDGLATWCQDAVDAADQVEESTRLWPHHSPYVAVLLGDVAAERERIIAALLVMHEENKMHHNYYGCLARLMQDGRL